MRNTNEANHSTDQLMRVRLHIAAMVLQQILAPSPTYIGPQPRPEVAARMALKYADALMAAADKGGDQ